MSGLEYFLRPHKAPPIGKILLVESGSRHLLERLIPNLRHVYGETLQIDLCTCFPAAPASLGEAGKIYRTAQFSTTDARNQLFVELQANGYQALGIICSAEPIMTRWKWMLAYQIGVRTFLINENADYVWFDRLHWKGLMAYASLRLGFEDSGAVRTLARIVLLPLSLIYLSLYALRVHALRALRQIGS
jgi:hypothetical protein